VPTWRTSDAAMARTRSTLTIRSARSAGFDRRNCRFRGGWPGWPWPAWPGRACRRRAGKAGGWGARGSRRCVRPARRSGEDVAPGDVSYGIADGDGAVGPRH